MNGLPTDTDLVTVTAGGNDLGYIGSMVRLGTAGRLSSRPLCRPLATALKRRGVPRPSEDDIDRATANLSRVVEETRRRAKRARVLLVDYLTVIGPDTRSSRETPLDEATLGEFRRLGDQVAEVFARTAPRTGAELVTVGKRSREHALGSAEPWVSGLPERLHGSALMGAFHPNGAGMRAVADAIAAHLR
ncbi:GDSL-type esterase/lipase family protein [Streptomyces bottropensis]|uniref:GDSL-type esterase/lipase family protein n=1 Tax=Streptomyces bottropensis TaxID=42235 RepID=UPI00369E380C